MDAYQRRRGDQKLAVLHDKHNIVLLVQKQTVMVSKKAFKHMNSIMSCEGGRKDI
jgi:hypothetical protein